MTQIITVAQLIEKLQNVPVVMQRQVTVGMRKSTANVKAEAMRNCTPGHSPYDDMTFPTKIEYAEKHGLGYSGAPYSDDSNPNREMVHLRDSMFSRVSVAGTQIVGTVGNTKEYALPVHEGTSRMWGRPFISDAIVAKQDDTLAIMEDAVETAIMQCATGDLFASANVGNMPTWEMPSQ